MVKYEHTLAAIALLLCSATALPSVRKSPFNISVGGPLDSDTLNRGQTLNAPSQVAASCDPKTYGASTSADDNAEAIQAALDQCSTGGKVTIDGGAYRTGPLKVHGHGVTLSLSAGSSIVMAYPPSKWPSSPDSGMTDVLRFQDCHGCSLTGEGLLHGGGITDNWYYLFDKGRINDRPLYLHVQDSTDFTLDGHLTLLDAPCFNVLLDNVTRGEITGLNITSTWYKDPDSGDLKEPHNTDGIDPSAGSSDIWIHDVFIHNGDDSIAVKPSHDESRCTRNILVENAHFEKGHGCSIGSVGTGCVENVVFRHITMKDQENGCRAKSYSSTDGAGFIRNITWSDIQMSGTDKCITVNANYKPPPKQHKHYVKVSDLRFSDISGSGCGTTAEFVCPESSPCEGIKLDNVQLDGPSMDCEFAHGETTGKVKPASCLRD